MSDQVPLKVNDKTPDISYNEAVAIEAPEVAQEQKKRTIKGMLMMALCCGAPLLLLIAIPFLGSIFGSLAAVGTGLLTLVALAACPLGMYFMMRMMTNSKK